MKKYFLTKSALTIAMIGFMALGLCGQSQAQDTTTVTRTPQQTTIDYHRKDGAVTSRTFTRTPSGVSVQTQKYDSEFSAGAWRGLRSFTGTNSDYEAVLSAAMIAGEYLYENRHVIIAELEKGSDVISGTLKSATDKAKKWTSDILDFDKRAASAASLLKLVSEFEKDDSDPSKKATAITPTLLEVEQPSITTISTSTSALLDLNLLLQQLSRDNDKEEKMSVNADGQP